MWFFAVVSHRLCSQVVFARTLRSRGVECRSWVSSTTDKCASSPRRCKLDTYSSRTRGALSFGLCTSFDNLCCNLESFSYTCIDGPRIVQPWCFRRSCYSAHSTQTLSSFYDGPTVSMHSLFSIYHRFRTLSHISWCVCDTRYLIFSCNLLHMWNTCAPEDSLRVFWNNRACVCLASSNQWKPEYSENTHDSHH